MIESYLKQLQEAISVKEGLGDRVKCMKLNDNVKKHEKYHQGMIKKFNAISKKETDKNRLARLRGALALHKQAVQKKKNNYQKQCKG